MQNAVTAVNQQQKFSGKAYTEARKIFFQMEKGKHKGIVIPETEGLRIRNALYAIIKRNPSSGKSFHSRKDKQTKEIKIWREI
jgi:hypothetical protein